MVQENEEVFDEIITVGHEDEVVYQHIKENPDNVEKDLWPSLFLKWNNMLEAADQWRMWPTYGSSAYVVLSEQALCLLMFQKPARILSPITNAQQRNMLRAELAELKPEYLDVQKIINPGEFFRDFI